LNMSIHKSDFLPRDCTESKSTISPLRFHSEHSSYNATTSRPPLEAPSVRTF